MSQNKIVWNEMLLRFVIYPIEAYGPLYSNDKIRGLKGFVKYVLYHQQK